MNTTTIEHKTGTWDGGNEPFKVSYGKKMMWFFIVSDALTFAGFLATYGFMRYRFPDTWPLADEVFTHFPFLDGEYPMLYVALMSFILIVSSVTMVLAVDAGHKMQKAKVTFYMFLTIIGGLIFLLSQAWEWNHFIHGSHGAMALKGGGDVVHFANSEGEKVTLASFVGNQPHGKHTTYSVEQVKEAFAKHPELNLRLSNRTLVPQAEAMKYFDGAQIVQGANLKQNEYGKTLFADLFFFITGFHGFHVFTGIIINIVIFINILLGTYEKRKSYEMVEKVGLYWHFVDLVWVFVFTFFYLV